LILVKEIIQKSNIFLSKRYVVEVSSIFKLLAWELIFLKRRRRRFIVAKGWRKGASKEHSSQI
jgi:hypothetical protein